MTHKLTEAQKAPFYENVDPANSDASAEALITHTEALIDSILESNESLTIYQLSLLRDYGNFGLFLSVEGAQKYAQFKYDCWVNDYATLPDEDKELYEVVLPHTLEWAEEQHYVSDNARLKMGSPLLTARFSETAAPFVITPKELNP